MLPRIGLTSLAFLLLSSGAFAGNPIKGVWIYDKCIAQENPTNEPKMRKSYQSKWTINSQEKFAIETTLSFAEANCEGKPSRASTWYLLRDLGTASIDGKAATKVAIIGASDEGKPFAMKDLLFVSEDGKQLTWGLTSGSAAFDEQGFPTAEDKSMVFVKKIYQEK